MLGAWLAPVWGSDAAPTGASPVTPTPHVLHLSSFEDFSAPQPGQVWLEQFGEPSSCAGRLQDRFPEE